MAWILDDHRLATTQPSALRQLASVLATLHREVVPRPGGLQLVQEMTDRPS